MSKEGESRRRLEPGLLLLISLAGGAKHGHAMLLDVERFSGQRLGPGTLYGALQRLEDDGFVEPLPAEERRVPYRLTDCGRTHLAGRISAMEKLVHVAAARAVS